MKIGLIQASSQKEKNKTLEHYLNVDCKIKLNTLEK